VSEWFDDLMQEALTLFRRGDVTRKELRALLARTGIYYKWWDAIEDEWRASGRMKVEGRG
jgi:hypothetical protein